MINVIYEDADILVCIKPAGTLSEKSDAQNSLPRIIEAEHSERGETISLFTVHRLDREVCGVMVYAKTASAAGVLSAAIADRKLNKIYLAVIEGALREDCGILTDLLFRDKSKNKTYVVNRSRKGVKDASLEYSTLAKSGSSSLLRIVLHTGRTHQIRAQLSSRGCSIVGDRKYGSKTKSSVIALCSHKLEFSHPKTKEPLSFTYFPDTPEFKEYENIKPKI